MKKYLPHLLIILIAAVPVIYLATIYNSLPTGNTLPLHFDLNFKPNGFGDKSELLVASIILAAVSVATYFMITYLKLIDPKRRGLPTGTTFKRMGSGIVVFMAVLNFMIIEAASGNTKLSSQMLFPLIGLLLAFIGNYMNNIKPNYFAGIRLPWTLNNDENWRRTHQFAGKLWFWGGLTGAAICLLFPSPTSRIIFIVIAGIIVILPTIYSYRIFRATKQENV